MIPGAGKDPDARWLNIYEENGIDEALLTEWLRQASKLRGWASFSA